MSRLPTIFILVGLFLVGISLGSLTEFKSAPVPYRVLCFMPSLMGETPTTQIILHDINTDRRGSADLAGSDGSYRPLSGELCFFKKNEPEKKDE